MSKFVVAWQHICRDNENETPVDTAFGALPSIFASVEDAKTAAKLFIVNSMREYAEGLFEDEDDCAERVETFVNDLPWLYGGNNFVSAIAYVENFDTDYEITCHIVEVEGES